jgi:hypothetical protein
MTAYQCITITRYCGASYRKAHILTERPMITRTQRLNLMADDLPTVRRLFTRRETATARVNTGFIRRTFGDTMKKHCKHSRGAIQGDSTAYRRRIFNERRFVRVNRSPKKVWRRNGVCKYGSHRKTFGDTCCINITKSMRKTSRFTTYILTDWATNSPFL